MKNKLFIIALVTIMTFGSFGYVLAAPYFTYQPTLLPQVSNAFDLGTSTQVWRNAYITQLCLSADCKTAWPTGGSGTVSTSSIPTMGNLAYWTSNAFPSLLGSVATTTLTGNNGLTLSAGNGYLVGGSNATLGLAAIAANSVLGNSTGASGVPSAIATSSLFQNSSATLSGLLTSTDWTTFNAKIGGSGTLTTNTIPKATGASTLGDSSVVDTGTQVDFYAPDTNLLGSIYQTGSVGVDNTSILDFSANGGGYRFDVSLPATKILLPPYDTLMIEDPTALGQIYFQPYSGLFGTNQSQLIFDAAGLQFILKELGGGEYTQYVSVGSAASLGQDAESVYGTYKWGKIYQATDSKHYLGNAKNTSFVYDGGNAILNPKEVGTGSLFVQGNTAIGDKTSLGSELVTNGTFTGSATGWTLGTNMAYGTNNVVRSTGATLGTLTQTLSSLTIGAIYYGSIRHTQTSAQGFGCTFTIAGTTIVLNTTKTYTFSFVATATSHTITFTPQTSDSAFNIDDVTVKQITGGNLSVAGKTYTNGGQILGAGSTTLLPIQMTSGTLLTTALAGGLEFLTDDYYATITTGAARKKFVLDDGTSLTSGRVPFATTNGRLTDTANFVFDGARLGIGTSSPYAKLSVVGETVSSYFTATSTTATSTFMGAVGIGTTTPFSTLSVTGKVGTRPFTIASSTQDNLFSISASGELRTGGGTPVISACGTTPNGSVVGNDTVGTVTVGGGVPTTCTVTYNTPKVGTAHVFIQVEGATALGTTVSAKSSTAFTATFGAALGGGTFSYWVVTD